jgi:hypothetical protein
VYGRPPASCHDGAPEAVAAAGGVLPAAALLAVAPAVRGPRTTHHELVVDRDHRVADGLAPGGVVRWDEIILEMMSSSHLVPGQAGY